MKQSAIKTSPEFFTKYIHLVEDRDLMEVLDSGGIDLYLEQIEKLKAIGLKTYAENKWTIPEIIEHLIDTERIFQYRALRFVRNDKIELAGFDENEFVVASRSNDRSIDSLLEEYQLVRLSTISFFSHLNEEELMRVGIAGGNEISVLSIGFVLVGHPTHHYKVIEDRYFSLIE